MGNPATSIQTTSFMGESFQSAARVQLPPEMIRQGEHAVRELTSPFPLVGGLGLSASIGGGVDATSARSQSHVGVQNSGLSGFSLA